MKLIEKKCPNCGGKLQFEKKDNEVTCSYCNASYIVDKDAEDIIGDLINPEQITKHFNMVSKTGTAITIISIVVFIIIMIVFVIMFMRFPRF